MDDMPTKSPWWDELSSVFNFFKTLLLPSPENWLLKLEKKYILYIFGIFVQNMITKLYNNKKRHNYIFWWIIAKQLYTTVYVDFSYDCIARNAES